jgi:hypothetical protein
MVWSISCVKTFNTKWCYNLKIWLWHAIHCFLSLLWSSIPSFMILELNVRSLSCLQILSTLAFSFDLWRKEPLRFFLSWWWPTILSCLIFVLTVWSLSCVQGFSLSNATTLSFDLWPWIAIRLFPLRKMSRIILELMVRYLQSNFKTLTFVLWYLTLQTIGFILSWWWQKSITNITFMYFQTHSYIRNVQPLKGRQENGRVKWLVTYSPLNHLSEINSEVFDSVLVCNG